MRKLLHALGSIFTGVFFFGPWARAAGDAGARAAAEAREARKAREDAEKQGK